MEESAWEVIRRGTGEWFVLHTKSRQEKALSSSLEAMRIRHFLPLIRKVRFHGPRKVWVEDPLFPSYLFLRGNRDEAYQADRTKRVAGIIPVHDQERIDWELKNIWLALSREACLEPHPFLQEGVRVEVRAGPLRGLQGLIQKMKKNGRLVLQVDAFGRAVGLEIDRSLLDPLG